MGAVPDRLGNCWRSAGRSGIEGKEEAPVQNKLASLDLSTIDLRLSLFDWAEISAYQRNGKLHLLLDQ